MSEEKGYWGRITDFRQDLTDKIINHLEQGTVPWRSGVAAERARNAGTDRKYNGINTLILEVATIEKGYQDPRWCTFKQAQENNWNVKKGEHGTKIEFWKFEEEKKSVDAGGKPVTETVQLDRPICRIFTVFNEDQLDGISPLERKPVDWNPVEKAEQILKNSGANIQNVSISTPSYSPSDDRISLPLRETFKSQESYYGAALHELAHWTGHSSRMNREITNLFGTPAYAKEELRAELASCFMNKEVGIDNLENNAAYIKSWIGILKEDRNEIFRAAADADRISGYIMEFGKEKVVDKAQEARPAPADVRMYVDYNDLESRNAVKELGAKYDKDIKSWYVPKGLDLNQFDKWLEGKAPALRDTPIEARLTSDEGKAAGAFWNKEQGTWCIPLGADLNKVPESYFKAQPQKANAFTGKSFGDFVSDMGLRTDNLTADGEIRRAPVDGGKPRNKDGAYVLYDDTHGRAGWAKNHLTGEYGTFREGKEGVPHKPLSEAELAALKTSHEQKQAGVYNEAAKKANYLVNNIFTPAETHPYLDKKGVRPHGALADKDGVLIIPMQNIEGDVRTFQRITPDGDKSYMSGGQKSGCFHMFGNPAQSKTIIVCEGFATGASLHESTALPIVCAMDATNMEKVSMAVREAVGKDMVMIIAGDNDHKTANNPGKAAAERAAAACEGRAVIPEFSNQELAKGYTDFNDLHQSRGKLAVRNQIESALDIGKEQGTALKKDNEFSIS